MERRTAIRNLAIIAGGIVLLPSCSGDKAKASILLNHLDVDADQEKLLAEITETFIPETDSPGAKNLNLHLFVLKMVDDCYDKNNQEKFISGLNQVEKFSRKLLDQSFIHCSVDQREQVLEKIQTDKTLPEELYHFYKISKDRTIQGYLNSKYVMTEKLVYELVPGRYNGYFPVKTS